MQLYDDEVPVACPKCGRKVIRRGNRHQRRAYCSGMDEGHLEDREYQGASFQVFVNRCDWFATIYRRIHA